jgi:hypothetical protein
MHFYEYSQRRTGRSAAERYRTGTKFPIYFLLPGIMSTHGMLNVEFVFFNNAFTTKSFRKNGIIDELNFHFIGFMWLNPCFHDEALSNKINMVSYCLKSNENPFQIIKELRGLSLRANYTDLSTATCRRS